MTRPVLCAIAAAAAGLALPSLAQVSPAAPAPAPSAAPATLPARQTAPPGNSLHRTYNERRPVDPSVPAGKMVFESTIHDFGRILDSDSVAYDFKFTNDGPGELVIYTVNSTCGCTIAELPQSIFKPGESGTVTLTYNPTGTKASTKRVTVESNDPDKPTVVLQIQAYVEQLVGFEPSLLSFGNLRKGEVQSRIISVIGRTKDFQVTEVSVIGNPGLTAEVIGEESLALEGGGEGRRIDIEVTTDGSHKPGSLQGQLKVVTNEARKPEVSASIAGAVMGDVYADVERLPIGILITGATYERIIRVENRLGKPFNFLGAELKAPIGENQVNWEILPAPEGTDPAVRSTYDLRTTITAGPKTGALRGTLVLKTDVPQEESIEIPFWGTVRAEKK
jgi:hypothetical protein